MTKRETSPLFDQDEQLRERLIQQLNGTRLGQPLYAYQRVDSTMEVAHRLAATGAPEGALVWAARQDQGRGRLGRTWESPEGGVYGSFILRPKRPAADIPQLSLVAGLAAAEAIRRTTGLSPTIRWPNDVLISEKKVCGILVEARDGAVVVGIGANVTTDPLDLPEHATSLRAAGSASVSREGFTGALCLALQGWYDTWASEGFPSIRDPLRSILGLFGQVVHIAAGSTRFEGTASDLDEAGRLVVRLDSGLLRAFDVGEVTLLR